MGSLQSCQAIYLSNLKLIIMEAGSILSADVLDIIFDARNKEYGAYDLRKNYQRRLVKAVIVTSSFVVLTCVTYVVLGSMKPSTEQLIVDGTIDLKNITPPAEPKTPLPPPPPPPPKLPQPDFKMIKNMVPIIVKDDVQTDVPEQKDLDNVLIGAVNHDGKDFDNTITPPVDENNGVVTSPKKPEKGNDEFVPIEVESQYPGGLSAWSAFLNRNLIFPQDAADNEIQGTVIVQFIVDAEGNVSNITALSGPEELRSAAVAVVKKSGKWTPALQNGRHVKSYKKQPITFKIVE
jgi:protein TonB